METSANLNGGWHYYRLRCPRKFGPPRAKFPTKFAPPGGAIFPGPYFLGNMASPSEIWPPRKHSLLYRYKLGKCLSVFIVSLHNLFVSKFFIAAKSTLLRRALRIFSKIT